MISPVDHKDDESEVYEERTIAVEVELTVTSSVTYFRVGFGNNGESKSEGFHYARKVVISVNLTQKD